jgi:hypothetical protein
MRYDTDDYYDENDDYGESYSRRTDSVVGKILLWVFLTPVLLALLVAVALFCTLAFSRFPCGDVEAALMAAPMSPEERYTFYPDRKTVEIKINREDVLFLAQQPEMPFCIDFIRSEASKYQLAVNRYDVNLVRGGVELVMEATAFGVLPLPIKIEAAAGVDNGDLVLNISRIWLTKRVSMTPKQLMALLEQPYSETDFNFRMDGKRIHPRLSSLTGAVFDQDLITLTCALGADEFYEASHGAEEFHAMLPYIDLTPPMQMVLAAAKKGDAGYLGDAFNGALAQFAQDPAQYARFRVQVLAAAGQEAQQAYFAAVTPVVRNRFLPGVTPEAVAKEEEATWGLYQKRRALWESLSKTVYTCYLNGELVNGKEQFYGEDGKTPFTLSGLRELNWAEDYAPWLDETAAFVVFMDGAPEEASKNIPPLEEMPHTEDGALYGLKNSRPYPVALVLTMKTGEHRLLFWNGTIQEETVVPEERFSLWRAGKRTPVLDYTETLHPELLPAAEEDLDDSDD